MNADDWELEMNQMLDSFDRQASSSLEKISERFAQLGRPFGIEFRQHFLKMSNLRLDSSFTKIELKHWNKSHAYAIANQNYLALEHKANQTAPNPDISTRTNVDTDHQMGNSNLSTENDDGSLVVVKHENHKDSIEIIDSDDEIDIVQQSNNDEIAMQNVETVGGNALSCDDGINNDEPDASTKFEIMDTNLPLVTFDPNRNSAESDAEKDGAVLTQQKPQSGKTRKSQRPKEQIQNKHLKCKQCEYATHHSGHFKTHQNVHALEKSMGIARDSNNLYHCTLCVRQFTNIGHLSLHMKSHKNNQYFYDCSRCMRQFVRKADKNRHESQCDGHYYECHLCKVFVTTFKSKMQSHMRTHSGARPFQCMVCSKFFTMKSNLAYHLNSVHRRFDIHIYITHFDLSTLTTIFGKFSMKTARTINHE